MGGEGRDWRAPVEALMLATVLGGDSGETWVLP